MIPFKFMSDVFPLLKTFQWLSITIKVKVKSLQYLHPHLFSSISFYSLSTVHSVPATLPGTAPPLILTLHPDLYFLHIQAWWALEFPSSLDPNVKSRHSQWGETPCSKLSKIAPTLSPTAFLFFFFLSTDHHLTFSLSCFLSVVPNLIPPRI